jgi:hypothetical protein
MLMPSHSQAKQPSRKPARVADAARAETRASPAGSLYVQRSPACACGGTCPRCRTSSGLTIGPRDDPYEREADRVAEAVIGKAGAAGTITPLPAAVQRKCAARGAVKDTAKPEDDDILQARSDASSTTASADSRSVPDSVAQTLGSAGQPLDAGSRSFFEPRFGRDLSHVRVHSGGQAARSARDVHAHAYTVGRDVVFGAGKYAPNTWRGRRLLAHELTHVVQQTGQSGSADYAGRLARYVIQRVDDASVESSTGVDQGIANGTMTKSSFNGQSYTMNCGLGDYGITFKFVKAYKGTYPYQAAGRDVRGVYVKIEASIDDHRYCGRCTPMRLLQALRNITRGSSGNMETADPVDATRRTRSGWNDASAPSRGWRVDTLTSATNPYYSSTWVGEEGSETAPARLWDTPGDWTTDSNAGKEFQTCAVCEDASHRKWVSGCVTWGYYTDSSGNINFRPTTPTAACGHSQVVRDASERWDTIPGNTATGISFGA